VERTSEILLRNEARLPPGNLLLVNAPRDALSQHLQTGERTVRVSTQNRGDYQWLSALGIETAFEILPGELTSCKLIVLHLPREKDRLAMMLHAISDGMPRDSKLWLVGENHAGIKSADKYLGNYFEVVTKLDNARHCGLYQASGPKPGTAFDLSEYASIWPLEFCGNTLDIISLPGVFAHGRLDKGTELLLNTLEHRLPTGRVLDFACGTGVIGCAVLAAGSGVELTLLDVSAPAIESSRRTLARNGLCATLLPSDGLTELVGRFDWIISNPPFHRGVDNDLEITARFFKQAGTFLAENGRIVIVCNRHLPYLSWLRNHYEQVDQLAGNNEFVVIQARKPQSTKE